MSIASIALAILVKKGLIKEIDVNEILAEIDNYSEEEWNDFIKLAAAYEKLAE